MVIVMTGRTFEGKWEEIVSHADELVGHVVRITILDPQDNDTAALSMGVERGWPPGFFERTVGAIPDLERPPQGEYEEREPLA